MDTATAVVETGLEFDEGDTAVRDTRIERLLEEWKLPFELDQTFSLARLKVEGDVQIRSETHRAPKSTVDQYVMHMKHGAVFPPIVVATNGMLIDGNARLAACQQLHRKTFPTYKVKFPHLGIAKMIGAALNQMGGDRLSDDEIVIAAEAMMAEGYADEAIARTLGRSISHVRNVRRDRTFREAADRTGLGELRLPKATMRVLAGIQHDEPFKAAVDLVKRANPSVKDTAQLVTSIEKTRSDAEALAAIKTIETQWGPVAGPPPTPRPLNRSHARKALPHVQALLAMGENPSDLVIPGDEAAAEKWRRLNALAMNVVARYATPTS